MKKNLLGWLAMATMLVGTGCSSDDVVNDYSPENAIEFGTYLGRDAQGRGVITTNNNLLNFGVYAYYTNGANWTTAATPNFMYDQKVSRTTTSDSWTYSPLKYWPTTKVNEFISFFAYAPYRTDDNGISVKSEKNNNNAPVITYTIDATKLDKMADFTADVLMNETKSAAGTNPDNSTRKVTFAFQHELTRLAIEAKLDREAFKDAAGDANKTKINIKKIDLKGSGFATVADYTFAIANATRGTWKHTTNGTLGIEAGASGSVLVNNNTSSWLTGYTQKGCLLENAIPKKIFGENNYLFLIPPTLAGVAVGDEVSMVIYYDIVTEDNKLQNGYSLTSAVKEIPLPAGSGLLSQGAAYRFTLTFSLNEVVFDAEVEDWPTTEGTYGTEVDYPDTDLNS